MIQVLLSTYNGARYLRPLLDSVLAQDVPDVAILARDDGSSDDTTKILAEYAVRHNRIEVVCGEHIGFAQSFLQLLRLSPATAEYLACCDQDDVWRPDKLSRAARMLSRYPVDAPGLYCSRLAVVDEHLNPLGQSRIPRKGLSFRNALVECPVAGCTMLLNRAARQVLIQTVPEKVWAHDWWIYLVVSAFGTTCFDPESRVLYRQHGSNVAGIRLSVLGRLQAKLGRFLRSGSSQLVLRQAEEFQRLCGPALSSDYRSILDGLVETGRRPFWSRLAYACAGKVYRQSAFDQLVLKALIACRRL